MVEAATRYRVDHPLFEGVEFPTARHASDAAERLVEFLIRNTDRKEASIETLQWLTEGDTTTWFFCERVEARLAITCSRN